MNLDAASAEAFRRWKGAAALRVSGKALCVGVIGDIVPNSSETTFTAVGMGLTWEQAFEAADRAPREVQMAALKATLRARLKEKG